MNIPHNTLATSNHRAGIRRALAMCALVALMAALLVCPFADDVSTITDAVANGMKSVYNLIAAIALPIATVVFAVNAVKMLFGGMRGMEQAKQGLLTCVIVIALIWLAPLIINTVGGWFKDSVRWKFDTPSV